MSVGLRCKDKVTIVTGGSRGIGKGIVTVFVRQGAKVVFCSNEEAEGKATEKNLKDMGEPGEAKFIFTDLRNEDHIKMLIDETISLYGRIDYVINNAGWQPPWTSIDKCTSEEFKSLMDLNMLAYFLVAKYSLPHIRQTQGCIINIGSTGAYTGVPNSSMYITTKGAIHAFTRTLATEEGKNNVLGRTGTAEEVGLACLYLAVEATFSTGIDIDVSGGILLNLAIKNEHNKKSWPKVLFP